MKSNLVLFFLRQTSVPGNNAAYIASLALLQYDAGGWWGRYFIEDRCLSHLKKMDMIILAIFSLS